MSWSRPTVVPIPVVTLRDALGVFLVTAFVGALGVLFWKAIPKENEQLIVYMLGQLSGFVSGIVAYHYVTKAGEKELDAKRADNTGKAMDLIRAATEGPGAGGETKPDVTLRPGETAIVEAEEEPRP